LVLGDARKPTHPRDRHTFLCLVLM